MRLLPALLATGATLAVAGLGCLENTVVQVPGPELPPSLVAMGPRLMEHSGARRAR